MARFVARLLDVGLDDDGETVYDFDIIAPDNRLPSSIDPGDDLELMIYLPESESDPDELYDNLSVELRERLDAIGVIINNEDKIIIKGVAGKGKQGMKWKNLWTDYSQGYWFDKDDVVVFDDQSWRAKEGHYKDQSTEPDDNGSSWEILVKKPPKWRNSWQTNDGKYRIGDVVWVNRPNSDNVEDRQTQYICREKHDPTTNNKPPNTTYWSLFLSSGERGAPGAKGDGYNFRGKWTSSPSPAYAKGDVVRWKRDLWVAGISTSGEPGVSADWTAFVKGGVKWIGNWSSGYGDYDDGDLVYYGTDDQVYICIADHSSSTSRKPDNINFWSLYGKKGQQGQSGPRGNDGDIYARLVQSDVGRVFLAPAANKFSASPTQVFNAFGETATNVAILNRDYTELRITLDFGRVPSSNLKYYLYIFQAGSRGGGTPLAAKSLGANGGTTVINLNGTADAAYVNALKSAAKVALVLGVSRSNIIQPQKESMGTVLSCTVELS